MPKHEIQDIRGAMKTTEVVLASAPARNGGVVRLKWRPYHNAFTLTRDVGDEPASSEAFHMLDGALAAFHAAAVG